MQRVFWLMLGACLMLSTGCDVSKAPTGKKTVATQEGAAEAAPTEAAPQPEAPAAINPAGTAPPAMQTSPRPVAAPTGGSSTVQPLGSQPTPVTPRVVRPLRPADLAAPGHNLKANVKIKRDAQRSNTLKDEQNP